MNTAAQFESSKVRTSAKSEKTHRGPRAQHRLSRSIAAAIVCAKAALGDGNIREAARCLDIALDGLDVPQAEIAEVLRRVERRAVKVKGIPVRTPLEFARYEGLLQ